MRSGPQCHGRRAASRGLSLVELMVGLVIGLLVVAGAAMVASTQLADSRRLLLETQLQQDLRAASDIMTREIRRAGSWAVKDLAGKSVWHEALPGGALTANVYTNVAATTGVAAGEIQYQYYRNDSSQGPFGFKLENGAIKSMIDGNVWQELTDTRTVTVTELQISAANGPTFQLHCPHDCPGPAGGQACWPTLQVREFIIDITANAASDPTLVRALRTRVRLRNDKVNPYSNAAMCPP